ncbi:sugar phosphate isomerase/epimerase family protein [Rhizosphaericola mali]|uniref:Sugar phosphate isomerase/epimerase n=1 Tax=Rhizosphaericola mali TaxID=2545455 RepID=A0A5P2FX89_9BACT|nr:sugar phosphate isomerase/epimerase [Rhizosphaericola mali]QES87805.1 sugar phosphate isomerase/epimerase [Rhizosphaericola mali]
MTSRRHFIRNSGVLTAGAFLNKKSIFEKSKELIGVQLYSIKEDAAQDLKASLQYISSIGYTNVELFGYSDGKYFGHSIAEVAGWLKSFNLKSTSAHYSLADYLYKDNADDLSKVIETAKTLQHDYVTIPWIDESARKSLEDFQKFSERLNKAGEACKNAGLKLAYHNHNFEFQQYGFSQDSKGNTIGYDVMLSDTDPSLVDFEMDIYWVVYAGRDPLKYFQQYPNRFPMWHIKDMHVVPPRESCVVGQGIIDFKEIFKHKKEAGFKNFFVEQEAFSANVPPKLAIAESIKYIKSNLITNK